MRCTFCHETTHVVDTCPNIDPEQLALDQALRAVRALRSKRTKEANILLGFIRYVARPIGSCAYFCGHPQGPNGHLCNSALPFHYDCIGSWTIRLVRLARALEVAEQHAENCRALLK
jgi:hypothetical protein